MNAKKEAEQALRDFHALCRTDISQAAKDALFRVGKHLAAIKEVPPADGANSHG